MAQRWYSALSWCFYGTVYDGKEILLLSGNFQLRVHLPIFEARSLFFFFPVGHLSALIFSCHFIDHSLSLIRLFWPDF